MADSESSTAPRRSQREKKAVKLYPSDGPTGKRKRGASDAEDDVPGSSDGEDARAASDEDEDGLEYKAPKVKPKGASNAKGKGKAATGEKGPPPAKKPRKTKSAAPKGTKGTTRKTKKTKEGGDAFNAEQVAKETKIASDNPLFNSILNPLAALQSTVEDFLESLTQSPGPTQAELINLILRACGCNDSVDADEVVDYDGVVDALDNFTEELKKENSPVYPLTSKLPAFKKFRKSLSEFIERLITSSADLGSLYTSDLMPTLQTWVIAMSSSQIRSFRHTATVVALEVETALCDVAAAVEKEAEVVGRQKEGERKRKASSKGGAARLKELELKATEVRERRTKLAVFLKEFVDAVFVHRYRDLDPNIRAECVRALGLWFKKYPGHFLDNAYLRYVGWVLSDLITQVRLEAVKALLGVYDQSDYIGSLTHFTERFKPRMIEMAIGDTELGVRVAVIQVLGAIDANSLLEDEEREKLCLLVFDEEPRVRKAVNSFVRGVWEEILNERLIGKKASRIEKQRAGIKALAILLVKWSKALDGTDDSETGSTRADEDPKDSGEGSSRLEKKKEVLALVNSKAKSRIGLAVEALWDEVEPVSDWEGLLDMLLLDHSALGGDEEEGGTLNRRLNGNASSEDSVVDDAWRLEEIEETVLLEMLVASLQQAEAESKSTKKGDEDVVKNDITRAMIKSLPRLFIKHQTDQKRIADVLLLPHLINLDLYLEMRMITAYANLWDDVIKQFTTHSSPTVLTHAVVAIQQFMDATSLSNTNSTKILELEDELSSQLRDAVAGRDGVEVASFSEDEVLTLGALCSRLTVLAGTRDLTAWMEEDESGKQSSAWDIISALSERGRLGYKDEETMIDQTLHLLTLHIMWKVRGLTSDVDPSPEELRLRESLQQQRESLLEKLVEYAVGTQSNTVEGVRRAAFHNLMNLYIVFCPAQSTTPDGAPLPTASIALTMDDEVQYRCAGFVQAEIERYTDELGTEAPEDEAVEDEDQDSSGEDDEQGAEDEKGRSRKTGRSHVIVDLSSRSQLEHEYIFMGLISTFLRAIRAEAIHIRHGAVLLAHYGRLGPAFDLCSKVIVDVLREEGIYRNNGDLLATVVTQAVQESFNLVLDGVVHDESHSLALSKVLASCFVVRGAQLSIVRRLDSNFIVHVHTALLSWIGSRLATYEKNKNKRSRTKAITFFKVLLPLLLGIESRDALKIKAHMDQVLAQAKVGISATSKVWEPQRAYEKRLGTVMSKDKALKPKGRKGKGKATEGSEALPSDEGEMSEGENLAQDNVSTTQLARPRPRPLRSTRATRVEDLPPTPQPEEQEQENDEDMEATPRSKPVPKATYRSPTKEALMSPLLSDSEPNGLPRPTSLKRLRPEDEEDMETNEELVPNTSEEQHEVELTSPSRQSTPTSDIQIRRKRARH